MAKYKLFKYGDYAEGVTDTEADPIKMIPKNTDNSDYIEYLAWVAAGNTPDPAS